MSQKYQDTFLFQKEKEGWNIWNTPASNGIFQFPFFSENKVCPVFYDSPCILKYNIIIVMLILTETTKNLLLNFLHILLMKWELFKDTSFATGSYKYRGGLRASTNKKIKSLIIIFLLRVFIFYLICWIEKTINEKFVDGE